MCDKICTVGEYLEKHGPKEGMVLSDGAPINPVHFPIMGIETYGAVLFADMPGYSSLADKERDPIIGLYTINNFFSWITGEGIYRNGGLLDKYIGDEIMMVFPNNNCGGNGLGAAIQAAKSMLYMDFYSYRPRIGIAEGEFLIAYVGSLPSENYKDRRLIQASTFGHTVNIAARCQQHIQKSKTAIVRISTNKTDMITEAFKPEDDERFADCWRIDGPKIETFKNIGDFPVIDVNSTLIHLYSDDRVEDDGTTQRINTIKEIAREARASNNIVKIS